MKKRVRIKLELSVCDKAFEIAGWVSVLGIWSLIIANYNSLPDIIPIHYNAAGEAGCNSFLW
jgi:hypothetical protein